MSEVGDRLTIYSDYVCPFCYLGRVSLANYQDTRDEPLELDWHPYDLRARKRGPNGRIDHTIDDGKDEEYYAQVRRNVDRLRERYGAEDMLPYDAVPDVDSFDAQLAAYYVAHEHPKRWLALDEAIFEALWIDGRDIGDVDVILELAESADLPDDDIRSVLENGDWRQELRGTFTEAHRRGVTAVPTFVYGEYVVRGAVPAAQLRRLVDGE